MTKQTKSLVTLIATIAIATLLVFGCAAPAPTPTPTEVIKWRYDTPYHQKDIVEIGMVELFDRVAERTNGQFIIEPHYSNELGYIALDRPHILGAGIVEIAMMAVSALAYEFPWVGIASSPFLIPVGKRRGVVDACQPMLNEFCKEMDILTIAKATHPGDFVVIFFRKAKPMTVDDFKGLKVRVWSKEQDSFMRKLGASPVYIPLAEVYLAQQKGVVDGMFSSSMPTVISVRHYDEVSETILTLWPYTSLQSVAVSQEAFDKLPSDFQEILLDEGRKYEKDLWENYIEDPGAFDSFKELAKEGGVEVYQASPEFYEAGEVFGAELILEWIQRNKDFSPTAGRKAQGVISDICDTVGGAACLAVK